MANDAGLPRDPRRRVLAGWLIGSALGALLVALPDADNRVLSLSETHGPSPVDLAGTGYAAGEAVEPRWNRSPKNSATYTVSDPRAPGGGGENDAVPVLSVISSPTFTPFA